MDAQSQTAAELMDAQYADFLKLHGLGLEQREYIGMEDMAALEGSFACMHAVMDSIRLRESKLPSAMDLDGGIRDKHRKLRQLIMEIQAVRQRNQETAERMLAATKSELRQLGRGRQAARGYGKRAPGSARLFDGTR
jgi:hypothetical protein